MRRLVSSDPAAFFIGWTLFLWVSRLRNVVGNDELDARGVAVRTAVVVVFVGLALAAALMLWRHHDRRLVRLLVVWTVGFWLVRGVGIALDDHDTAFLLVHAVLMIVSIGLAMWVWLRPAR